MDVVIRAKARYAVQQAIKHGTLQPQPCQSCGELLTEAHHYKGYQEANWLDVRWFCSKHHKVADMQRVDDLLLEYFKDGRYVGIKEAADDLDLTQQAVWYSLRRLEWEEKIYKEVSPYKLTNGRS